MAEREVSIDTVTYELEEPFLVLANQNPIEQEGTYPLTEAELDRFIARIPIGYLSREQEVAMLQRVAQFPSLTRTPLAGLDGAGVVALRRFIREHMYVDPAVAAYAVDLVRATRPEEPSHAACLADLFLEGRSPVQVGASPRASLALLHFAKVAAFLHPPLDQPGRNYVTPADVAAVAFDVLNHRLILHELSLYALLGRRPVPYLNAALRVEGQRVLQRREALLQQIVRRILRGVPLP
ncbi:MAG: hypothetical protein KatS3mg131_3007 [Candidatus Tectimicrobiota bacterium]|nr:MAG: hypothetical protein KatS3mg131_3007 [Candidatus Tectomicrobia bacterium]